MFWAEVQAPFYFRRPDLAAQRHNLAEWGTRPLPLLHLASCLGRSFIPRQWIYCSLYFSNSSSSPLNFKFRELSLGIQGSHVSSLRAFVPGLFAKDMVAVPFLVLSLQYYASFKKQIHPIPWVATPSPIGTVMAYLALMVNSQNYQIRRELEWNKEMC